MFLFLLQSIFSADKYVKQFVLDNLTLFFVAKFTGWWLIYEELAKKIGIVEFVLVDP